MTFRMKQYVYGASEAELCDLEDKIRYGAAKRIRIDAERLTIQVKLVVAYEMPDEELYFRADSVEAGFDGTVEEQRRVRSWVRQLMLETKGKPDPKRLTLEHEWHE